MEHMFVADSLTTFSQNVQRRNMLKVLENPSAIVLNIFSNLCADIVRGIAMSKV